MAPARHATSFIHYSVFIFVAISLALPMVNEGSAKVYDNARNYPHEEKRLTREYHLRQGALRGLIVKPGRQYELQNVEMFLGIPYAAAPIGSLRFMPPVSAPPWPGVKMATHFAPVCPQSLPAIKKGDPPSLGRQNYMNKLKQFLKNESEDCLYLNIYVPYREHKSKKFPVLVFIHGDSFEWSSGNPYDGRILASYGNIMVITVNYRLGVLGFVKPSLTEHEYGNNGLLDQLAALKWIKDNIEDLNGDPDSVTLMGHGTGAACVNFLMLSPISNALFHRAILMSGSALSDWAMTKNPAQYTLQVAQGLGCNPTSKSLMTCLQNKRLSDIKKVQILAREFETPLGPTVAGYFVPNEPEKTMESFPNLLSKYQLLSGVTQLESYHDFGVIELDQGILENQRDDFIKKYIKITFDGAEDEALKDILKQYSKSKMDPQRWNVDTNRDVILNLFSDARTLAPMMSFANYQSKANRQSYFYVFGHNSVSTDYAHLNKSVHGEEMPYVLGIPLGGANSHFHTEYTPQEKLLSEVMMRLWTNFVKNGSPNTQSVNEYNTLDKKHWAQYNVEWPEYNELQQPFLKLDIPPSISSSYRKNYTSFWQDSLPNKMKRYVIDPLFEYTPRTTTTKPKTTHRSTDPLRKIWSPQVVNPPYYYSPTYSPSYGKMRPVSQPVYKPDTDKIYREIQAIKTPSRPMPPGLIEKVIHSTYSTTTNPISLNTMPVKTSGATITLIISLGSLFIIVNIGICVVLYLKKRRMRMREREFEPQRHSRADNGEVDVIGQKCLKDDKSALQTLKNGCSVIKTMSFNKMKNSTSSKKVKKKSDPPKTPKSDDSGGFRERFQLRRHLSTSTLDAHTKVRDWITNEVMHRCSPGILRKSNSILSTEKETSIRKPFTRSEELLSDNKNCKKDVNDINEDVSPKNLKATNYRSNKTKSSDKTTSTSALGSQSSIESNKQSQISKATGKSNDSLKSKETESIKSKKVSVAIDATPAARTNSILKQEPIEYSKSFDIKENRHSKQENKLQRSKTEGDFKTDIIQIKPSIPENNYFTNVVTLSLNQKQPLKISHKHSCSDPVTDVNYEMLMKEKMNSGLNIPPPAIFRNDINVTSRDEVQNVEPLSPEDALVTIKRRNFPKVLPDLPASQKRLSLQTNSLQTFKNSYGNDYTFEKTKVPPQPPPRTTTLEKRLAYKNSKPLSSFGVSNSNKYKEVESVKDYENIDSFSTYADSFKTYNKSIESSIGVIDSTGHRREYPKVIIASSDKPCPPDKQIVIQPSPSQVDVTTNVPRVKLPDDFHSHTTESVTTFSSVCSDDYDVDDELMDDITEDKLIQELVGGVESPTSTVILDSKGPETVFEKNLEIISVKLNADIKTDEVKGDFVWVSDFFLPGVSDSERTAQIKPNFGLNKMQQRSESINTPPEKAIKVKQKRTIKPAAILNKRIKSCKSDSKSESASKLEHSNSGSSNDTESSTGTVKKVDLK